MFVCLFVQSISKGRTVTTDRHFLLKCIHTNKFISYSGSQLYMAASFSTKESQQTRRRVVGGPFNGRPLPEQFVFRPSISGKCEHSRNLIHCRESCLFLHSSISFYQLWYRTYPQQSNGFCLFKTEFKDKKLFARNLSRRFLPIKSTVTFMVSHRLSA